VLPALGVTAWRDGLDLLVEAGLWEVPDGDAAVFHKWDRWNGIGNYRERKLEQDAERKRRQRWRDCVEKGKHTKDCPPEICPKKGGQPPRPEGASHASRDSGTGRVGTGRVGEQL
jgi:hypothetical protein